MTLPFEDRKDEIIELYVTQQRPLTEVMRLMAAKGFNASQRAYRDKFARDKWNITKYNRRGPGSQSAPRPKAVAEAASPISPPTRAGAGRTAASRLNSSAKETSRSRGTAHLGPHQATAAVLAANSILQEAAPINALNPETSECVATSAVVGVQTRIDPQVQLPSGPGLYGLAIDRLGQQNLMRLPAPLPSPQATSAETNSDYLPRQQHQHHHHRQHHQHHQHHQLLQMNYQTVSNAERERPLHSSDSLDLFSPQLVSTHSTSNFHLRQWEENNAFDGFMENHRNGQTTNIQYETLPSVAGVLPDLSITSSRQPASRELLNGVGARYDGPLLMQQQRVRQHVPQDRHKKRRHSHREHSGQPGHRDRVQNFPIQEQVSHTPIQASLSESFQDRSYSIAEFSSSDFGHVQAAGQAMGRQMSHQSLLSVGSHPLDTTESQQSISRVQGYPLTHSDSAISTARPPWTPRGEVGGAGVGLGGLVTPSTTKTQALSLTLPDVQTALLSPTSPSGTSLVPSPTASSQQAINFDLAPCESGATYPPPPGQDPAPPSHVGPGVTESQSMTPSLSASSAASSTSVPQYYLLPPYSR